MTPVKGKFAILKWAGTSQPAVDWTLPITCNPDDTSNFRDGRQRVGTLDDADGITFTLVEDQDASTLGTITAGAYGTLQCYTNNAASKFYQLVVLITQVSLSNPGVNATLRYAVTAGLHGTITYPA
jgi:hypothetical protein